MIFCVLSYRLVYIRQCMCHKVSGRTVCMLLWKHHQHYHSMCIRNNYLRVRGVKQGLIGYVLSWLLSKQQVL